MRTLILLFCLALFTQFETQAQDYYEFELDPGRTMLMTGKGPGQDGSINPFFGQDCIAIVENTGKEKFSIRIQKKGNIINTIMVTKGEVKKIKLLKDHELYIDSESDKMIKAKIGYAKIEE